jgi:hypothetical protein
VRGLRNPDVRPGAAPADQDNPGAVADLLRVLREAGASGQATTLASRCRVQGCSNCSVGKKAMGTGSGLAAMSMETQLRDGAGMIWISGKAGLAWPSR